MQFADVFVYDSDCTACCMFCYVGELSVAFVICLDVAILLLNVTVLFCVWVSLLLSCPCMVSIVYVCFICGATLCSYVPCRCMFCIVV